MIKFDKNSDVIKFLKKERVLFVDFKFTDLNGVLHHTTVPADSISEKKLAEGVGFDGSSIKGFKEIEESDMLLKPDIKAAFTDPFCDAKTLSFFCFVFDPQKGDFFEKCPRYTAYKAEQYLVKEKIADRSYWGPEVEFFVFDKINWHLSPYDAFVKIGSLEVEDPSLETRSTMTLKKSGYYPAPPYDKKMNFRNEVVLLLKSFGIKVDVHHHEVAAGGQGEIDMRYDTLVAMADNVQLYKYIIRNVAANHGFSACFLPKPIYGDNGSGMHVHQSLWKGQKNLFYERKGYGQLSDMALSYIGGILININSLLGFCAPTLNSYRRLVPHYEAPVRIAFSKRNRSAAVRIPMYFSDNEDSKRVEFRCPDPSANPYFCFAGQLVAGVWGIKNKINPTKKGLGPHDENMYLEDSKIASISGDLFHNVELLQKESLYVKSGVFDKALIESYTDLRLSESREALLYPSPADFWFGY